MAVFPALQGGPHNHQRLRGKWTVGSLAMVTFESALQRIGALAAQLLEAETSVVSLPAF